MNRTSLSLVVITALLVVGCPGSKPPVPPVSAPAAEDGSLVWKVSKSGLGFRISNADDEGDNPRTKPPSASTPLPAADARKMAARLPALKAEPDDAKDFSMRAGSIPAPRPGTTVTEPFPPPAGPPPVSTAPPGQLKIERHQPDGNVALASNLSLTFSQPMVAVTSVDQLEEHPPVRLIPEPPGKWRWLGTRTVLFQPERRFPMATAYAVEVPAGTKSINGSTLAAAEKFTFDTPPLSLVTRWPTSSSEVRDPLIFVGLDQVVDPKAFFASVELTGPSGAVPIKLAEMDEVEANTTARRLAQQSEKGRWIAFRPIDKLPVATGLQVRIKAGAPSAEGPKKTEKEQSFGFSTYRAMRVSSHSCSGSRDGKRACPPLTPFSIVFSNEIDMKSWDPRMISFSPEIPGVKLEVSGQYLSIRGKTKGRTTYAVTVSEGLGDTHGQTLGQPAKVTFDVGPADPALFDPQKEMFILDPLPKAKEYQVYSINEPQLRARIYAVTPEDWRKYASYHQEWERPRKLTPPGRLVAEKLLTPRKAPDELVTTPVDLSPALTKGFGQVVVVVEPTRTLSKNQRRPEIHAWIQATEIGLDALIESDQVTAWSTRLQDGASLEGVDVQLLGAGSARTDAQGLARVALSGQPGRLIVGKKGGDLVMVPEYWFNDPTYQKIAHADQVRWFVFDDRGMYKPGEEVRVKGWVRRAGMGRGGDLDALPNVARQKVTYRVRDPRGAEIGTGETELDEHGGFDLAYKLPGNANLGRAQFELSLPGVAMNGTASNHAFQVEEFRRPEFEVTARSTEGPHVVGKHAVTTLSAAYYSGGGLPDAPVEWRVTREDTSFTPPNRSAFHFGPEPHMFWWHGKDEKKSETWVAKTNPQGLHRIRLDFDSVEPSYPMSLDIVGNVTDVNRQGWAGRTSMVVHPSETYAGLKLAKSFIRAGETIEVDAVVVDLDGKALSGQKVTVKAARIDSVRKGTEYAEQELEVQTCDLESSSASSPLHCSFKTRDGGSWRVWSVVTDAHGRKNRSTTSLWVMGGQQPKDRSLRGSNVELLLDRNEYEPGALAELLVVTPFTPAEGVLTVRRQGITHIERFRMTSSAQTMRIKLDEDLVPNATIAVDLVGQDVREDASGHPDPALPARPAFAKAAIEATILPTNRKLTVTTGAAQPVVEPGASTRIDVDVKDAAGRGVSDAEVALIVADEAVLALSSYKTPDALAAFYARRSPLVTSLGMRDRVLLGDPELAALQPQVPRDLESSKSIRSLAGQASPAMAPAPGALAKPALSGEPAAKYRRKDAADDATASPSVVGDTKTPMQIRTNFAALALFSPKVKTDAKGHASVPMKLPDNLTRYRVMAVAATKDKQFGSGESTLTARLPVMVRPSAPRFLNFGDAFELPVVVQNQTDKAIEVGVIARATNATVAEPSAKQVKIPPNDRVEVRFNASADRAGTARFQLGVATGGFSDASQIELPVYTPATTEAFATYGEIDEGAIAQPVKMPPNVFPQFGGLEVTTSSTQLQALTDAVVYLYKYPFECNEQLASRVIAIAALRDVLSAFKSKDLPPPEALTASMKSDFEKLKRRQHSNGGWGFWQEEPWPYLTAHVAHALARAKEKGYAPDQAMWDRSLTYLRSIEQHIPAWYGVEARRAIIAYSIYVRNRMKDPDALKARKLLAEAGGADKLGIEAVGWIWATISADAASATENEAIRRHVANRVTEAAGAAHFVSGYQDSSWVTLSSDRRADGVLLEALIGDQKDSTLIPKLVKGLLGHRKAGRWTNTQENAFVLLALDRYFATYEKVTPDFVARVWLGDRFAGDHTFKGRTTEYSHTAISMQFLAASMAKEQNVVIGKDGPGRLYWRVGMQYAPTDLRPAPADYGFVVSRLYEGADSAADVKRDADGTWRVKAGAKVRVRVSMVAPARRYHVALVDPIPAGLEPMNAALAVTGDIPKDPNDARSRRAGFWSRTWYEHQNMRDERVEAFASMLWDGVWSYDYVARATTPGTFVVPPAKAEEMYSPETFGRSAGDRMIIE